MLHPVSPNFSLSLVTEDKRVRGFGVSTDSIPTWVLKIKKSLNKQDPVTDTLLGLPEVTRKCCDRQEIPGKAS